MPNTVTSTNGEKILDFSPGKGNVLNEVKGPLAGSGERKTAVLQLVYEIQEESESILLLDEFREWPQSSSECALTYVAITLQCEGTWKEEEAARWLLHPSAEDRICCG